MKKITALVMAVAMMLTMVVCSASASDAAVPSDVEDGVLTIAMECAYAPYNWTQSDDSNGAVPISNVPGSYANGYDVMIGKKIAEANGWELEVIQSDWDSLVPGIQTGKFDAVIAGQSMTAERSEQVDFAGPYFYATIVCVTKADSMLMALETGMVDFICTDMPTAQGAVAAYPDLKILDFSGTDGDFQFDEDVRAENVNIGVSVMKGNTALKEKIDAVLSTMTVEDFNSIMEQAIAIQPLSE